MDSHRNEHPRVAASTGGTGGEMRRHEEREAIDGFFSGLAFAGCTLLAVVVSVALLLPATVEAQDPIPWIVSAQPGQYPVVVVVCGHSDTPPGSLNSATDLADLLNDSVRPYVREATGGAIDFFFEGSQDGCVFTRPDPGNDNQMGARILDKPAALGWLAQNDDTRYFDHNYFLLVVPNTQQLGVSTIGRWPIPVNVLDITVFPPFIFADVKWAGMAEVFLNEINGVLPATLSKGSTALVAHELGHTLGLPDLYAYGVPTGCDTFGPAGSWGVMGCQSMQNFLSYTRVATGWLDEDRIDSVLKPTQEYKILVPPLTPGGGTELLRLPRALAESPVTAGPYYVEVRDGGWDAQITDDNDGDGLIDEDPSGGGDEDGDGQIDEDGPGGTTCNDGRQNLACFDEGVLVSTVTELQPTWPAGFMNYVTPFVNVMREPGTDLNEATYLPDATLSSMARENLLDLTDCISDPGTYHAGSCFRDILADVCMCVLERSEEPFGCEGCYTIWLGFGRQDGPDVRIDSSFIDNPCNGFGTYEFPGNPGGDRICFAEAVDPMTGVPTRVPRVHRVVVWVENQGNKEAEDVRATVRSFADPAMALSVLYAGPEDRLDDLATDTNDVDFSGVNSLDPFSSTSGEARLLLPEDLATLHIWVSAADEYNQSNNISIRNLTELDFQTASPYESHTFELSVWDPLVNEPVTDRLFTLIPRGIPSDWQVDYHVRDDPDSRTVKLDRGAPGPFIITIQPPGPFPGAADEQIGDWTPLVFESWATDGCAWKEVGKIELQALRSPRVTVDLEVVERLNGSGEAELAGTASVYNIYLEEDEPLPNARIVLNVSADTAENLINYVDGEIDPAYETTTDSQGRFIFRVPVGSKPFYAAVAQHDRTETLGLAFSAPVFFGKLSTDIQSLSVAPDPMVGGGVATGTLTLTDPVPAGGSMEVDLTASPELAVPATVTVPENEQSITFPIGTEAGPGLPAPFSVTASWSGRAITQPFVLLDQIPTSLVLADEVVRGGDPTTATVTLLRPAPPGGSVVSLATDNSALVAVPSKITVPQGQPQATFVVETEPVTGAAEGAITAAIGGGTVGATITLMPEGFSLPETYDVPGVYTVFALATADLDGDGDADVVIPASNTDELSIALNTGTGDFAAPVNESTCDIPVAVIAADLDGNGDPDIAVACTNGDVRIHYNYDSGSGTFDSADTYPGPVDADAFHMTAADLDGDGDIDLAVVGKGDPDLVLLRNEGRFIREFVADLGAGDKVVKSGNIDRDGDVDLVVSNVGTETLYVLRNQGTGTFDVETVDLPFPTGNDIGWLELGDFDADGDLDIALAKWQGAYVWLFPNDGTGSFRQPDSFMVGSRSRGLAAADSDGDGTADLASANRGDETVSVLWNDGAGLAEPALAYPAGDGAAAVEAADVNGDGLDDLVAAVEGGFVVLRSAPNTPESPSTAVTVDLPDLDVDFEGVIQRGTTYVEIAPIGPVPPPGYQIVVPPRYLEINSTAGHSGLIRVSMDTTGMTLGPEPRMLHYVNGLPDSFQPGDLITDGFDPAGNVTVEIDRANNRVVGEVTGFSTFFLVRPEDPRVVCPADVQRECPDLALPSSTGTPTVSGGAAPLSVDSSDAVDMLCGAAYAITRNWSATDGFASDTCAQRIEVADTLPPDVTAGSIGTCYGAPSAARSAALLATFVSDTCGGNLSKDVEVSPPAADCWSMVTVRVTDGCGNEGAIGYDTRIDTEAPALTCPADAVVEQTELGGTPATDPGIAGFLGGAVVTDTCDGAPTLAHDAPAVFPLGETRVRFGAVDCGLNRARCAATVTVEDTTPPSVSCPPDVTVEQTERGGTPATQPDIQAFLAGAGATDICDTAPSLVNDGLAVFPLGITTVIFSATDASGNAGSCRALVTVEDTTPPDVAVTAPPDGLCTTGPVTVTADIYDICDAAPDVTYDPTGGPTYSAHGDYDVTVTATDDSGNSGHDGVFFTIDLQAPDVAVRSPSATPHPTLPHPLSWYSHRSDLPIALDFTATDDDGATGEVLRELAYLDGTLLWDGATFGNGDGLLSDELPQLLLDEAILCGTTQGLLGNHTLRVEAVDCAGNVGTAEVRFDIAFEVEHGLVEIRPRSLQSNDGRMTVRLVMAAFTGVCDTGLPAASDVNRDRFEVVSIATFGRAAAEKVNTPANRFQVKARRAGLGAEPGTELALTGVFGNGAAFYGRGEVKKNP